MDRKRLLLLVVAAALIALAALASRCADEAKVREPERGDGRPRSQRFDGDGVVYPRDAHRRAALNNGRARPVEKPRREAAADPIQNAMAFAEGGTLFFEVNAIRHSDVATKLLACRRDEATDAIERFRAVVGIDPLEDVDRVAVHEDLAAVSGFFDELKLPEELGAPSSYGDGAEIYAVPNEDPEGAPMVLGKVGGGLLLLGDDEAELKQAIDRVEGRGPRATPLANDVMKSEIYGRIGPGLLAGLLGGAQANDPLLARLGEMVAGGTVRALIDDHVSMSLDLETKDAEEGEDLAKAIGGALAGARQQALAAGREDLKLLLDEARVLPGEGGKFGIDLAVPGDVILAAMGCVEPAAKESE